MVALRHVQGTRRFYRDGEPDNLIEDEQSGYQIGQNQLRNRGNDSNAGSSFDGLLQGRLGNAPTHGTASAVGDRQIRQLCKAAEVTGQPAWIITEPCALTGSLANGGNCVLTTGAEARSWHPGRACESFAK